jgi:hypothetical protein
MDDPILLKEQKNAKFYSLDVPFAEKLEYRYMG